MAFSPAQRKTIQQIVAASVAAGLSGGAPENTTDQIEETDGTCADDFMHHTHMGYPSCISHVSLETVNRIRWTEYIDLAMLLPPQSFSSGEPAPKRFKTDVKGALSGTTAPKGKIENLATWTEAWSIFSLIAIHDHFRCAVALMQHKIRMVQAARKYRFSAVVDYCKTCYYNESQI